MALKQKYKSQDEIPSELQSFYTEQDGEFVLQVDGLVPKTTVDEFRSNNIKLTKELAKMYQLVSNDLA